MVLFFDKINTDIRYFNLIVHFNLNSSLTSPRMGIVRDYSIRGQTTFHDAFIGSVFVDWLVDNTEAATVDEAIKLGRRLLEINMIKHGKTDRQTFFIASSG